jgi:acetyl-CoA/propionyl-CoA carboxylase, biotin carboxylase, biotin carboxyl carrier protein
MSIGSTAVYSDADREGRFVLEADEAYRIGPAPAQLSYLNQSALIATALTAGCDAVHPGYGFLAENADFAEAVGSAGLLFIGPSPASMRLMGDKISARRAAIDGGVPVVPGTTGRVTSIDEARAFAAEHGLPLLVKAGGGGGGRGIRVVEEETQLPEALERAAREAETFFGNRDVYLEKFFRHARHIEVQVAGDARGNVVAWGERDCSTQRRRQKLVEESPAPGLDRDDREAMTDGATRMAQAAAFVGVGTVEFLYAGPRQFFFLEMNTRIQVEHTVTEEVTGQDLIRESVIVSAGHDATIPIESRGHAIEARINAEDPARGFAPGPGLISQYREPGGPGVRVDSGVYQGFTVPGDYDSLVAKLIARAPNREQAIGRLLGALGGFHIAGVPTTINLLRAVVDSTEFRAGRITTDWLDANIDRFVGAPYSAGETGATESTVRKLDVEVNGKRFMVRVRDPVDSTLNPVSRSRRAGGGRVRAVSSNAITSPMRGTVLAIKKQAGEPVARGDAVLVVEAMKMENEVNSPRDGRIVTLLVSVGDTVESGQPLAELGD